MSWKNCGKSYLPIELVAMQSHVQIKEKVYEISDCRALAVILSANIAGQNINMKIVPQLLDIAGRRRLSTGLVPNC